jgi:hypothetical protein
LLPPPLLLLLLLPYAAAAVVVAVVAVVVAVCVRGSHRAVRVRVRLGRYPIQHWHNQINPSTMPADSPGPDHMGYILGL